MGEMPQQAPPVHDGADVHHDQQKLLKPVRVTADLPKGDFELLQAGRKRHGATTSDLTRAFLRIHAEDPDLAERVAAEIEKVRQAEADSRALKRKLGMLKRTENNARRRQQKAAAA
jgi:hypothetical protein